MLVMKTYLKNLKFFYYHHQKNLYLYFECGKNIFYIKYWAFVISILYMYDRYFKMKLAYNDTAQTSSLIIYNMLT